MIDDQCTCFATVGYGGDPKARNLVPQQSPAVGLGDIAAESQQSRWGVGVGIDFDLPNRDGQAAAGGLEHGLLGGPTVKEDTVSVLFRRLFHGLGFCLIKKPPSEPFGWRIPVQFFHVNSQLDTFCQSDDDRVSRVGHIELQLGGRVEAWFAVVAESESNSRRIESQPCSQGPSERGTGGNEYPTGMFNCETGSSGTFPSIKKVQVRAGLAQGRDDQEGDGVALS